MTLKRAGTLPLVFAAGCAFASFKNTWRSWDTRAVVLKKDRIVVMALNMPRTSSLGVEAAAADELRQMGFQASAAYEIRESVGTGKSAKAKLQNEGFATAIVFRVTTNAAELFPTPGRYEPQDSYLSYWRWGGGWAPAPPPIESDGKVFVETLVYSVRSDRLLWSGVSEAASVSDVSSVAGDLVRTAISELRNAGLIL